MIRENRDGRVYLPFSLNKEQWPDKVLFCFKRAAVPEILSDMELLKAYALTYRISDDGKPLDDAAVYTAVSLYEPQTFFKMFIRYHEGAVAIFEEDGSFNTYTFSPKQREWFIEQFKENMSKSQDILEIFDNIFTE